MNIVRWMAAALALWLLAGVAVVLWRYRESIIFLAFLAVVLLAGWLAWPFYAWRRKTL